MEYKTSPETKIASCEVSEADAFIQGYFVTVVTDTKYLTTGWTGKFKFLVRTRILTYSCFGKPLADKMTIQPHNEESAKVGHGILHCVLNEVRDYLKKQGIEKHDDWEKFAKEAIERFDRVFWMEDLDDTTECWP